MLSGSGLRKMDEISRRDEGRQLGLPERRQGASYLSVPLHLAARLGIDLSHEILARRRSLSGLFDRQHGPHGFQVQGQRVRTHTFAVKIAYRCIFP